MSKKGITPKKQIDPIDKIVNQREQESIEAAVHRFAFNIPQYIYDIISPKAKKQGMTLTNYLMYLIRKDIGEI